MEYTFKLEKAAKKTGGDKYNCDDWIVYFPQEISRSDSEEPEEILKITVNK